MRKIFLFVSLLALTGQAWAGNQTQNWGGYVNGILHGARRDGCNRAHKLQIKSEQQAVIQWEESRPLFGAVTLRNEGKSVRRFEIKGFEARFPETGKRRFWGVVSELGTSTAERPLTGRKMSIMPGTSVHLQYAADTRRANAFPAGIKEGSKVALRLFVKIGGRLRTFAFNPMVVLRPH